MPMHETSPRLFLAPWTALAGTIACVVALGLAEPLSARPVNPDSHEAMIEEGRELAEQQCASCHAIGTSGKSPNRNSPVFRTILSRYSPGALAEELREGIRIGHLDMPYFQLSPRAVDGLIAYLVSIQEQRVDRLLEKNTAQR